MNWEEFCGALVFDREPDEEGRCLFETLSREELSETGPWQEEALRLLDGAFDLFGELRDAVLAEAAELRKQPLLLAYLNWGSRLLLRYRRGPVNTCRRLPFPTAGGPASLLKPLPFLAMLPTLVPCREEYRRLGLSEKETARLLTAFRRNFLFVSEREGEPAINRNYFNWLCLYLENRLFNLNGFNFELKAPPEEAVLFRNKQTGEKRVLRAEEEKTVLPGEPDSWEKVYGPGELAAWIHIPRQADLSPENLDWALTGGLEFLQQALPGRHIRGLCCFSWLLDPQLETLLGQGSRIVGFQQRFLRFPVPGDEGRDVFEFAFPPKTELESFEPRTRLQRALRERYLAGGRICSTGGYYIE